MTAAAVATRPQTFTPLQRILNVTRLQFTNPATLIFIPWMIMGLVLLLNIAIWWLIGTAQGWSGEGGMPEGISYSGGSFFMFVYMLVVAVQAMNLTFPFAQGYSVTRRDFYLGLSLCFVILSAFNAVIFTLLGMLERATRGWWLGGAFFDTVYYGGNPSSAFLITFLGFLLFFFLGAAIAAMYVRWKAYGIIGFFVTVAALLIGGLFVIGLTNSWVAVGTWFVTNGVVGVMLWSLIVTALSAVAGFLLLRRATPRN